MAQYIDKDAVLAEIERRIKVNKECMLGLRNLDYYQGKIDALNDTLSGINTLEVKELSPLTWEDMLIIHKCIKDAMNFKLYKMMEGVEGQKEVYEEVLKRFKEQKDNEKGNIKD